MKVGVFKRIGGTTSGWTDKYIAILKHNNVEYEMLDPNDLDLLRKVEACDVVIYHWAHRLYYKNIAHTLLPIIEHEMGKTVLPNQATCWHFDDKVKQTYLMKQKGFSFVDTWVFWDRDKAYEWIETAQLPLVFKMRGGAGSTNVLLVRSKAEAQSLVDRMLLRGVQSSGVNLKLTPLKKRLRLKVKKIVRGLQKAQPDDMLQREGGYVMFQKFLPNNKFDTRVTVIGDRAFAYRRFNRDNDFRASGSGKNDYNAAEIDPRCVATALRISKAMGFQSMAYDFLFDENRDPAFCEMCYTFVDTYIFKCPGYWDGDLNLVEGHFWPEYLQLVDVLGMPDLKQPEFESKH